MGIVEQIEAVLFYRSAPMSVRELSAFFEVDESEVFSALDTLREKLHEGPIRLVQTETEAQLATAPELADVIEKLRKDDMSRDIGRAGAETLAIILYRGPLSRAEIDRIRGVNSTFILRNLLIRGLIKRTENKKDQRTFLYSTTPELLAHLGITRREELPDFERIMDTLDTFENETSKQTESGAPALS